MEQGKVLTEFKLQKSPVICFHGRIIPQIKTLAENPRPSGCRKITGSKNDWRMRIGDYGIIYEIYEKAKEIVNG